jgi:hypothetical protein
MELIRTHVVDFQKTKNKNHHHHDQRLQQEQSHGETELGDGQLYEYSLDSSEDEAHMKPPRNSNNIGKHDNRHQFQLRRPDDTQVVSSSEDDDEADDSADEEEGLLKSNKNDNNDDSNNGKSGASSNLNTASNLICTMSVILCVGAICSVVILLFVTNFYYRLHHISDMQSRIQSEAQNTAQQRTFTQPALVHMIDDAKQLGFMQSVVMGSSDTVMQSLQGCWQPCYDSNFGDSSPSSLASILGKCIGNWVFVYTNDDYVTTSNNIIAGAFAKKSFLLGAEVSDFTCETPGADCFIDPGVLSQGVYWYHMEMSDDYGDRSSFGFSTAPTVTLNWNYGYVDVGARTAVTGGDSHCKGSLSWSLSASNNGRQSPSAIDCIVSSDARYRKRVMTNTCPLQIAGL